MTYLILVLTVSGLLLEFLIVVSSHYRQKQEWALLTIEDERKRHESP